MYLVLKKRTKNTFILFEDPQLMIRIHSAKHWPTRTKWLQLWKMLNENFKQRIKLSVFDKVKGDLLHAPILTHKGHIDITMKLTCTNDDIHAFDSFDSFDSWSICCVDYSFNIGRQSLCLVRLKIRSLWQDIVGGVNILMSSVANHNFSDSSG